MCRFLVLSRAFCLLRRATFLTLPVSFMFGVSFPLIASAQQANAPLPEIQVSPPAEPPERSPPKQKKRVDAKPKPRPIQADSQAAPPATSDSIVTSPTAVPTPVGQVASSISVVTAKDIEQHQWRSVPDALQSVPGLNVVQNGGPGGQTSVFIRGTNSAHTKFLIDGIDVGDPSTPNGAYDLGQLMTADIDRIEVLRGPQSGLYGSDAIGGVISITTKKGQGPAKVTAMVEGGSRSTANTAAGVTGSQDKLNYALNVSTYHTGNTPVTPSELLVPGQIRNNDSFTNKTASTKLGYDFTEDFGLNVVARYTDSNLGYTGDQFPTFVSNGQPGDVQSKQNAHQLFTRSEAVWSLFDGRLKNYFGFNYGDQYRANMNPYSGFPTALNPVTSTAEGEKYKYDWRGVVSVLPGQTVVLGADDQTEKFANRSTSGTLIGAQNGNRGAYAELQSNFNDRLFFVSNIRIDDNDEFGDHVTYRFAPAYILPGTETKLKASYGTGFKAPTLSQLYDTSFGSNNPNLKPEESVGYDVGFEQPIANDKIRFGTTYFNNRLTNLINNIEISPNVFQFVNVDNARTSGFESFANIVFDRRFSVRVDHTYTFIEATSDIALRRKPSHKASVSTTWNPTDDLNLTATVLWTGNFLDIDRYAAFPFASTTAPGFTVVNLAANYTVAPGVVTFARIDNLLDERYQDPLGFLRPGLGVFGGLRFTNIGPGEIASK